jgi:hypothetical protein
MTVNFMAPPKKIICNGTTTYKQIVDFLAANKDKIVEVQYETNYTEKGADEFIVLRLSDAGIAWILEYMGDPTSYYNRDHKLKHIRLTSLMPSLI